MVAQLAPVIAIERHPVLTCPVCSNPTDATASGPCHGCADRLPTIGDCPLTVALVVALVATETHGGGDGAAYCHLSDCPVCRSVLDGISATAAVARMELDYANADDYAGTTLGNWRGWPDGAYPHHLPPAL